MKIPCLSRQLCLRFLWSCSVFLLTFTSFPSQSLDPAVAAQDAVDTTARESESEPGVTFRDVALEAGLRVENVWGGISEKRYIIETKGAGLALADFDRDGWTDVYLTNGIRFGETYTDGAAPTSRLYRNRKDGTFEDITASAGVGRTGWQTGVCVGDYNNDGWDDLYCGFWGKSILFRNNGDGTFTDVTRAAGLEEAADRWASGCTWIDYDLDGFLDLYSASYIDLDLAKVPAPGEKAECIWRGIPVLCGPRGLPAARDLLFHNKGDGTFTDKTKESGIAASGPAYSITPVSLDFDNDRWPDIYVAVDSDSSLLFHNQQDGTFKEVGMAAGCAFSENGQVQAGMGVGVGDFNCDGWLDIFKTNFQHDNCNLYQNLGDGTFRDVSSIAGLGLLSQFVNWGAGFVDFDNDAWPDIFYVTGHVYPEVERSSLRSPLKTPRIVYRNLGNGRFEDVSERLGPGIRQSFSSRGCAFGDLDNDGDEDAVVLNMNDRFSLLRNDGGNRNNWINIKLIGTKSNRSAVGARVRVFTGEHVQLQEVLSGGSVMSQNDFRLHFGLSKATVVDLIEVTWPVDGAVQRINRTPANRFLVIEEGKGLVSAEPGTWPVKGTQGSSITDYSQ